METQIFHHPKRQFSKKPLKETKILQDIVTSMITKLKVSTQAKISSFKKSSYKKK
jgi:hypothetical protein